MQMTAKQFNNHLSEYFNIIVKSIKSNNLYSLSSQNNNNKNKNTSSYKTDTENNSNISKESENSMLVSPLQKIQQKIDIYCASKCINYLDQINLELYLFLGSISTSVHKICEYIQVIRIEN